MTLTERIEKVLALDAKRTGLEWSWRLTPQMNGDMRPVVCTGSDIASPWVILIGECSPYRSFNGEGNAAFIAAAPEMIAIIREQKAELERLRLYAVHKEGCSSRKAYELSDGFTFALSCDCGLNDMMGR